MKSTFFVNTPLRTKSWTSIWLWSKKKKPDSKSPKRVEAAEVPTEDSDSDTDISMNMIEEISPTKKQKLEKYKEHTIPDNEKSEEEKA